MAPAERYWFRVMLICLDKVRLVWCGRSNSGRNGAGPTEICTGKREQQLKSVLEAEKRF